MAAKLLAVMFSVLGAFTVLYDQLSGQATQYEVWKIKHNIKYQNMQEEIYRKKIFYNNLLQIKKHNLQEGNSYKMGVNQFSGYTDQQFYQLYLKAYQNKKENQNYQVQVQGNEKKNQDQNKRQIVGNVDWISQGAVTEVKYQGKCGSDWAFSVIGCVQAISKINYGTLQKLSEQQLIDCADSYGNSGCLGGSIKGAIQYIEHKGISHDQQYPYLGTKQTCKKQEGNFKITGVVEKAQNCQQLMKLLQKGVISVSVNARTWAKYSSGVITNCQGQKNHNALLVGFNDGSWVVKNSWGTQWGENGYIRLKQGNTCGICNNGVLVN